MLRRVIVVKATALVLACLLGGPTLAEEPGIFTPASPAAPPLRRVAAAKESFANFRQDPEWLTVKAKSKEQAGGSLTEKENGVVSLFLVPTEYSPLQ